MKSYSNDELSCSEHEKRTRVLAFGDILKGEQIVGLHICEALRQIDPIPGMECLYLGREYQHLPSALMDADFGIIVHWLPDVQGIGCVERWDRGEFLDHITSGDEASIVLQPLGRVLQGLFMADLLPRELVFLLPRISMTRRIFGLGAQGRATARRAVEEVRALLRKTAPLRGRSEPRHRVYGIPWLKTAL